MRAAAGFCATVYVGLAGRAVNDEVDRATDGRAMVAGPETKAVQFVVGG